MNRMIPTFMVEIPDPDNWDMIIFDVDGTLLDRRVFMKIWLSLREGLTER